MMALMVRDLSEYGNGHWFKCSNCGGDAWWKHNYCGYCGEEFANKDIVRRDKADKLVMER